VIIVNEQQDLKIIEQESYRELLQDGFTEMLTGSIFLALPAILIKPAFVSIFVVFYIFFIPQAVEVIRKKYTYPRIGYVRPHEDEPLTLSLGVVMTVLLIFIIIIAVLYSASIGVIDRFFILKWMPAVVGFIMCGPSLYLKDKTGRASYYLPGILMPITGLATSLADFLTAEVGTSLYMVGWGLAFVLLGIIRFALFIHKYPVIDDVEVDTNDQ
jgi:hypothetical protein